MKIHCIKHVSFEGPGAIAAWAEEQGHEMAYYKAYLDQDFPDPEECEFVVIMGGPMNVYEDEKYPWLKPERTFLKAALENGAKMLGICLGAQLLADVLGGSVTRNEHREIGFFPVQKEAQANFSRLFKPFPDVLTVLHWHGDTFSIPPGALHAFKSLNCSNQAFAYEERVVGLQFHLETTEESLEALLTNCAEELTGPDMTCVQTAEDMRDRLDLLNPMHGALFGLLDRMARTDPKPLRK